MKKFVFAFATLALAAASAASNRYLIKLYEPVEVAGQTLRPGDYTLEVKDNRAVLKGGKQSVETAVQIENNDKKYGSNVVKLTGEGPGAKLDEIRIGGTTTRVMFPKPGAAGN